MKLLPLLLLAASMAVCAQANGDVREMATTTLLVKGEKAELTNDGVERLTYSIQNRTANPVRVMLMVEALGMCTEYGASSLKLATPQEALDRGAQDGLLLLPGQTLRQSITGGKNCIRPNDILHFVGFFLVRLDSGAVRAERFALGNFYIK